MDGLSEAVWAREQRDIHVDLEQRLERAEAQVARLRLQNRKLVCLLKRMLRIVRARGLA